MGAFFLYKDENQEIDLQAAKAVFEKKGFVAPVVFYLGKFTLLLYRKQLVTDANYLTLEDGSAVYATGTVVYKGLSYRDTLCALLEDFRRDRLDMDALLGNFCLIFYINGQIKILTDQLGVYHVFIDEHAARLSTSFLALLASYNQPQPLNRMAFYEKMSTGYIVGPDTLISGVRQLTPQIQTEIKGTDLSFIVQSKKMAAPQTFKGSFNQCVEQQLHTLQEYYKNIAPLALEYGVDMGLSSGYDSRLMLLLAQQQNLPVSTHSHLTRGVHEAEVKIANSLAGALKVPFRTIETKKIEDLTEEQLQDIFQDGLYYYDGRTGDNSGAFSQTYTRAYKTQTLGCKRLRLNGEGGEIYRNYYYTSAPRVHFRNWLKARLFYWFAEEFFQSTKNLSKVEDYLLKKISLQLKAPVNGWVDQSTLRRFYGEVHLPACEAFLANADNQLAFFLFPFMEAVNLEYAYQATPFIGLEGRFEAAMIEHLNPDIAAYPSHYGFPINKPPLRYRLYSALRGYLPDQFWYRRKRWLNRGNKVGTEEYQRYSKIRSSSPLIYQIESLLSDLFPELNLQVAFRNPPQRANLLYIGYLFLVFQDKILFQGS